MVTLHDLRGGNIATLAIIWKAGDVEQAKDSLERALALAEDLDDPVNLAQAHYQLGNIAEKQSDMATASHHTQRCLDLSQPWMTVGVSPMPSNSLDVFTPLIPTTPRRNRMRKRAWRCSAPSVTTREWPAP